MNILTYTSLYPSPGNPVHGIFVSQLTHALARLTRMRVVVPENGLVQFLKRGQGSFPRLTATPRPGTIRTLERASEDFSGHPLEGFSDHAFEVARCRFWTVPKVLKFLDYRLMAFFSRATVSRALSHGVDLVHAHYAYPDAAAANLLARRFGLPLVVTCHGSDLNVLAKYPARGRIIGRTLRQASAVAAVSGALVRAIEGLGVPPDRIHHIPNGVDLARFPLGDKKEARKRLGLPEHAALIVAAGRLEPVKGFDRLLRALVLLDNVRLILVGDGGLAKPLKRLAQELGVKDRVRFTGMVPHDVLAPYFQAADALVMASESEGWPTVIHEALACGTPVAAPAVGGIPEALDVSPGYRERIDSPLIGSPLGLVLPSSEPEILARGIREVLGRVFDQHDLRQAASLHGWDAVARRYVDLFERVLRQSGPKRQEAA